MYLWLYIYSVGDNLYNCTITLHTIQFYIKYEEFIELLNSFKEGSINIDTSASHVHLV